ncbi:uncharacterized protein F4822DRAFT_40908 [Hypoxylon trugodes]|uniref:uncharacterized protein n=1 Tax=Hypoxylon trugodes TaxID=326681 RepID=UPI0021A11347|nr:uncharacterized protein F4822DRAFT_40908 [Hypoxylon trugodes]KAI1394215.1 hypothetical protein F4822DRAFT_40908 [Hypoxylon trugodes]
MKRILTFLTLSAIVIAAPPSPTLGVEKRAPDVDDEIIAAGKYPAKLAAIWDNPDDGDAGITATITAP